MYTYKTKWSTRGVKKQAHRVDLHPRLLYCALLCVLSHLWCFCPIATSASTGIYTVGSYFSTNDTSAFWFSKNGECTFGFKPIPAYNAYLLSLWFTKDSTQTPIWWPAPFNSSLPPLVKQGAVLRFSSSEGSLDLQADDGSGELAVIWNALGSIGRGSFAVVTDTCNLVVLDVTQKVELWQSFADSRDSLMLPRYGRGILQDEVLALNKPYLLQSKKDDGSFAPGRFHVSSDYWQNLALFCTLDQRYQNNSGTQVKTDYIYMYGQMDITGEFRIKEANGKSFVNDGTMAEVNRLTLGEDGNLQIYSWKSNSWSILWQMLDDKCKFGSPCGPFAICKGGTNMNESVQCSCPFNETANTKLLMKASRKVTRGSVLKVPPEPPIKSSNTDSGKLCGSNMVFVSDCTTQLEVANKTFSMLEVPDADYYWNNLNPALPGVSIEECKELCIKECKCIAASYSRSGDYCMLKGNPETGLLMNGYENRSTTLFIKIKITDSQKTEDTIPAETAQALTSRVVQGAVIVSSGVGILGAATVIVGCMWLRYKRNAYDSYEDSEVNIEHENGSPSRFTFKEIVEMTEKFSSWLGEGGFGIVYKGWIKKEKDRISSRNTESAGKVCSDHSKADSSEQGQHEGEKNSGIQEGSSQPCVPVAVKVLKVFGHDRPDLLEHSTASNEKYGDSGQKQFEAEVSTLGKIHHVNLVSLLGYCLTRRRGGPKKLSGILVYEYMENGSLDKYLVMPGVLQEDHLPWPVRYSIALGTARGLAYLHHGCSPPIIHCDIKPQNILLDKNFNAKVADFGLACTLKKHQSHLTITGVRGTRGYLAPEWLSCGEVTPKVDVFSYGMLLLELVYAGQEVENAAGVIVNRSALLHWALQSIQPATETGSASNFTCAPRDQADIEGCKDLVEKESLYEVGFPNRSLTLPIRSHQMSLDDPNEGMRDVNSVCASSANEINEEKLRLIKIGLWCVQFTPSMRPSMSTVVQLLQGTIPVDEPPNPTPYQRLSIPSLLSSENIACTS